MSYKIRTGLDLAEKSWPRSLVDSKVGLLVHPASVNGNLFNASDVFQKSRKFMLKALFGPQHGIKGETQDNMIEWEGYNDPKKGIPVFSLYGRNRKPSPLMLKDLDVLVIDLQDIGARYYTFIWTMALAFEACQELKKTVVVLDRPNPIGGHIIEGPVLKPAFSSFVGLHPLPVRHGMTIGEIALYLNDLFYPFLKLHVIPIKGWERKMWFDKTKLFWVLPSPNIPTLDSATVYPGMCLLEGTNLSEGRGTTRPFEIFGAPFIEPDELIKRLNGFRLPGVIFRPLYFLPTFQKYSGILCGGAQIHVTDRERFKPFKSAVTVLKAIHDLYPDDFAWKNPPYEYEEVIQPIDMLAGTDRVRKDIEQGVDLRYMEAWWDHELREFDKKIRRKYLLY
ncbi:MAG: DUF1343 domain-containing protein [Nitrospirota bacterium]